MKTHPNSECKSLRSKDDRHEPVIVCKHCSKRLLQTVDLIKALEVEDPSTPTQDQQDFISEGRKRQPAIRTKKQVKRAADYAKMRARRKREAEIDGPWRPLERTRVEDA